MSNWVKVHAMSDSKDATRLMLLQEDSIQSIEAFDSSKLDPADYRVALGVQTVLTFLNGSRLLVLEPPGALATLLSAKG